MNTFKEFNEKITKIRFDSKREAVPYNCRLSYKMMQISLILAYCSKNKGCSLFKIHLLSMAMMSDEFKHQLRDYVIEEKTELPIIRFDPLINKTLDFMEVEKIVEVLKSGYKYKLTPFGKKYVEKIEEHKIAKLELEFVKEIGGKLTEDRICKIRSKITREKSDD